MSNWLHNHICIIPVVKWLQLVRLHWRVVHFEMALSNTIQLTVQPPHPSPPRWNMALLVDATNSWKCDGVLHVTLSYCCFTLSRLDLFICLWFHDLLSRLCVTDMTQLAVSFQIYNVMYPIKQQFDSRSSLQSTWLYLQQKSAIKVTTAGAHHTESYRLEDLG